MIPNRLRDATILATARLGWGAATRVWHRVGEGPGRPSRDVAVPGAAVGLEIAASAPPASTLAPAHRPAPRAHSRLRRMVLVPLDVALVAALVLVVFVGYGMLGNRWYHVIAIEGGSMEPTIARGDLIVVTPAPAAVQPGMILTLQVGRRIVTHRVVAVRPDGSFVTRGDANNTNDDWGSQAVTVYGQYAFRIPALGRFLPVSNVSGASFADRTGAAQQITVAHWTPAPAPDAAAAP